MWVYGTAAEGDTTLYKADLKSAAAIVIGNEGEGMSRLVSERCDFKVSIPMKGSISSLNASAAAAIMLYEAVRQRSLTEYLRNQNGSQCMKKQSQDQTNEQLHIDDAAAAQEEYSLEDIMNEFGGWSREGRSRAETAGANAAGAAKAAGENAGKQKAGGQGRPFPEGPAHPRRAESPKEPKNPADFKGQTIRFTPIREDTAPEEKPKIWTYQAEPDPEPVPDDPKEAKKAAQRAKRAEKEAKKRQKQLERHQKQQAKRMERRKEQPEREFPDCRAAYTYYAQGTFQRLRLFLSILLAIVSGALAYFASYSLGSYDFTANADVFSKVLLIIMVVQAFIAFDVMLRGVRAVMKFRYDHASMLVVLTLACAVDAVLAIRAGRVPFCPAVTLQLSMALLGEYSMGAGESTARSRLRAP